MRKTNDVLLLEEQLCFPLYAASNLITRLYRPLLAKLGLTYPQYLVMMLLWEAAPQSVSDLGKALHLDSGTLTPLLKRLEISGLVLRRRDDEDERRVFILLTEKGSLLRASAESIPKELQSAIQCSPKEISELRDRVNALISRLQSA
ncbi:MarR family winged helix-turn-helix transcriptional regulator [Massilia niabensis]|uniref:MarR family winged helix-turn-helix transcriptional regulator n=1 Tax=Massilia niabensis TaxID=544910 RepID=A0ABW0L282_9BURK